AKPERDRLIPDTALPLQVFGIGDTDVMVRVRRLKTESLDVGDVELKVAIEDDQLSVNTVNVVLSNGGSITAALDMALKHETDAELHINIDGQQIDLRPPIDVAGNPIRRPSMDLNMALSGSGSTIRQIAASANGSISLRQGEGEIDNAFGGYIFRDFVSQVFGVINPSTKDSPHTNLQCGIFQIDVVDGIATTRVAGLQSDQLAAASVGTVNLATEALDFSFRTKPREGIGISLAGAINPYIKLGGTLANPSVKIDTKRGVLSGTAAALSGGLSILAEGVWDRYLSADDLCRALTAGLESGEIGAWDGQLDKIKERFRPFRRKQ
ncbi:MAG: AsmA-like C-terminal region-containing protein, partial [Pseudomonadales bacterium]